MKKAKTIISVLLAVLIVFSAVPAVSAAETGGALSFTEAKSAATEITYKDGSVKSFSGFLNPESIESSGSAEAISSYKLLYNGKSVIEVTLNDIHSEDSSVGTDSTQPMNGYYAAEFELTGANKEAFITGLNPSNLGKVQRELINSYVFDGELMIEDHRRHLLQQKRNVNFDGTVNIDDATALQKEIAEYNVF